MDIVKEPKIDWLSKRWLFLGASLLLILAGMASIVTKGGLKMGVDFVGGTLVYARFKEEPSLDRIRGALAEGGLRAEGVTRFDDPSKNEVQIRLARIESEETADLILESDNIAQALRQEYDSDSQGEGRVDLNNVPRSVLSTRLQEWDPEGLREDSSVTDLSAHYQEVASRIVDLRTGVGLFGDYSELSEAGLGPDTVKAIEENSYLGNFVVLSVESVGPKVGQEMQERAWNAVFFSLLGILAYITIRFKFVHGLAAIAALFHDVLITVGALSLTDRELTLTVVAALLTLVGYSINDTIVVFDRLRENEVRMRRSNFYDRINASINQILNRTIMTSGSTFVALLALFLLGGPVLNSFSFALVIGIIVGTYSSIGVASPIVSGWHKFRESRRN